MPASASPVAPGEAHLVVDAKRGFTSTCWSGMSVSSDRMSV
jgi:hypothetical protein